LKPFFFFFFLFVCLFVCLFVWLFVCFFCFFYSACQFFKLPPSCPHQKLPHHFPIHF
jgi:hypothetical protein